MSSQVITLLAPSLYNCYAVKLALSKQFGMISLHLAAIYRIAL